MVLLAMSFVVLPLLPDRGLGPYGAVNPYELWSLTILLAGVSFLAYALAKIFGPSRGLLAASLAGALVSSTAVTLSLARVARDDAGCVRLAAAGALLAGGVMAARILAVTAVLAPSLIPALTAPLGAFALGSAAAGAGVAGRRRDTTRAEEPPLMSPVEFGLVLKLALVLGIVMAAARAITAIYGAAGLLPLSALAGVVDVDAVVLATARMTTAEGLDGGLAVQAVLLAAAVDSVSKTVISVGVGGRRFGELFAAGTCAAVGLAAMAFVGAKVAHGQAVGF